MKEKEVKLSDEDKALLINTINKKGFFLEEKAYEILHQRNGLFHLNKNVIPRKHGWLKDNRVEIDLVFDQGDKDLIIECKKTDYTWIFPKSLVGSDSVNFIYEIDNGMDVRCFEINELKSCSLDVEKWKICYSEPMSVLFKLNWALEKQNKKFAKTQNRNEDPIQRAVLQVLHQTKEYRMNQTKQKNYSFFIPIILTNATLLFMDYNKKQIDSNSNLVDYNSLNEAEVVVYNYSEMLDWPNARNERTIKSVFIVNINYFNKFLDLLEKLFMGDLNRARTEKKGD